MTIEQALDALVDQAEEWLFLPREVLRAELATWEIEPVWVGDAGVIGAVLRKGAELHFATFKRIPLTRGIIANALRPQIERYGYVETKTPHAAERQHRFNRLIGFHAINEDSFDVTYRMEKAQCRLSL